MCTRENILSGARCANGTGDRVDGYDPATDRVGDDYGLLFIDANLGAGNYMAISAAGDATIAAQPSHTIGYPAFFPSTCNTNFHPVAWFPRVWSDYDEVLAFEESDSIAHVGSDWYGTDFDATGGQSGSPIFYFPNPSSGAHYVTSVLSRHTYNFPSGYWVMGPKASTFRGWVLANMH